MSFSLASGDVLWWKCSRRWSWRGDRFLRIGYGGSSRRNERYSERSLGAVEDIVMLQGMVFGASVRFGSGMRLRLLLRLHIQVDVEVLLCLKLS